jgi:hypothetical protein
MYRWEDGIRMDLREIGLGGVDWIRLAQDRDRWRAVVSAVMNATELVSLTCLFCSSTQRNVLYLFAAVWWYVVSAVSADRLETGLRVASCSALQGNHLMIISTDVYSNRYKLQTAKFNVWSWNEDLTAALHFSVTTGAYYGHLITILNVSELTFNMCVKYNCVWRRIINPDQ